MWTKFKLPFKWAYVGVFIFAFGAGFWVAPKDNGDTFAEMATYASIAGAAIFLTVAAILFFVNSSYNVQINPNSQQVKLGRKVYSFARITQIKTIVRPGSTGVPQIDLMFIGEDGKKGKLPVSLPFFAAIPEKSFHVLYNAIPGLISIPAKPEQDLFNLDAADRKSLMELLDSVKKAYYEN